MLKTRNLVALVVLIIAAWFVLPRLTQLGNGERIIVGASITYKPTPSVVAVTYRLGTGHGHETMYSSGDLHPSGYAESGETIFLLATPEKANVAVTVILYVRGAAVKVCPGQPGQIVDCRVVVI